MIGEKMKRRYCTILKNGEEEPGQTFPTLLSRFRYVGVFLVFIMVIGIVSASSDVNPNEWKEWEKKGRDLYHNWSYFQSIKAIDNAINLTPEEKKENLSDQWLLKGRAFFHLRRGNESISAFDKALQLSNDTIQKSDIWTLKALAIRDHVGYEPSLIACDNAIQLYPNNSWAYYIKGEALRYLSRDTEALDAFNRGIQIDPDDENLWNAKSVVLENIGEIEESKKAYNESVKRGYDPTVININSINAPNPTLYTISPDVLSGDYEG